MWLLILFPIYTHSNITTVIIEINVYRFQYDIAFPAFPAITLHFHLHIHILY